MADSSQRNLHSHLLKKTHRAGVFDAFGDQHPASAALRDARAVQQLMNARVDLNPGPHGLLAEICALGNLNLLLFVDEIHNRHGSHPGDEKEPEGPPKWAMVVGLPQKIQNGERRRDPTKKL